MIIAFLGESINSYRKNLWYFLSGLTLLCPVCQSQTHSHAWYGRSVKGVIEKLQILRVRCCDCGKTHSVIPDFLSPYKQYPQAIHQAVLEQALDDKIPIEQIVIAETTFEEGAGSEPPSLDTLRRWIRIFRQRNRQYVGALVSFLARQGHYIEKRLDGVSFYYHLTACFEQLFHRPMRGSCLLGQVNILLTISQIRLWV